jgi:large subunit ribosomal protein L35
MSSHVHRHLVEQRWRKEGALSLLVCLFFYLLELRLVTYHRQMERMHQMNVIPDILPDMHPSLDMRVSFQKPPGHLHAGTKRKHQFVEPGVFLLPKQVCCGHLERYDETYRQFSKTLQPPRLYTSVFHADKRLYTLLMVDPGMNFQFVKAYWLNRRALQMSRMR